MFSTLLALELGGNLFGYKDYLDIYSTAQAQRRTCTITCGEITHQKVGVAPILIASLCTSNHRVKTRD